MTGSDRLSRLAAGGATAALTAGAGLVVWTLVPLLFGWSSSIVTGGSMRPAVQPGDVIISSSPTRFQPGDVIRFRVPGRIGRPVLHRIVGVTPDGALLTKGDANAVVDGIPVPVGAVTGTGRWRVPWIGLPVVWWLNRDYPRLAAALTTVVLLSLLALRRRPPAS
ncbi:MULTISPECIES: signal peptidase I [Actinoplanes]|uniref:signal peptidase I n=1 Tax=Actinoplanes TaxID=1865 RepID=UPI0005F2C215|nr:MULTISPECIES: signal peptidase I [Actinoplanes]GLY02075.1 hypothetical protein Acsp01_24540 [Actinoplanes sp. NBRC 101535]